MHDTDTFYEKTQCCVYIAMAKKWALHKH